MPEPSLPDAPLLRVLFVEDAPTDYNLLVRLLGVAGYKVQSKRVVNESQLRDALTSGAWDAIIADHDLPEFSSTEALRVLRETGIDVPFIIVSGTIGEDFAAEAMIAGADDYISKSRLARLAPALKRSIAAAATRRTERAAQARLHQLKSHVDQARAVKAASRDLQDGISALMSSLTTDVTWLARHPGSADVTARLEHMQNVLDRTRAEFDYSMQAINPPLLERGIVDALEAHADNASQCHGIPCTFTANQAHIPLNEASFFAVYRTCQEAVARFARDNQAKSIRVAVASQPERITLLVSKDSATPNDDSFTTATWLDLRESVAILGGTLTVNTKADDANVVLTLPVEDVTR